MTTSVPMSAEKSQMAIYLASYSLHGRAASPSFSARGGTWIDCGRLFNSKAGHPSVLISRNENDCITETFGTGPLRESDHRNSYELCY